MASNSKTFFVRLLSELHVSSQTIYVINTDMVISTADFTALLKDEGKSIKRVSQRSENVMTSVTRLVL